MHFLSSRPQPQRIRAGRGLAGSEGAIEGKRLTAPLLPGPLGVRGCGGAEEAQRQGMGHGDRDTEMQRRMERGRDV